MQNMDALSQEDFERIAALVCAERDRIKASKEVTVMDQIGEPAFLLQLAEECSELAQAALKLVRKMGGGILHQKHLNNAEVLCKKRWQTSCCVLINIWMNKKVTLQYGSMKSKSKSLNAGNKDWRK